MQTFDSVQSACFVQAAHASLTQIGVGPPHAVALVAVHCTQVPPSLSRSQTALLASWQSLLPSQEAPGMFVQRSSVGFFSQKFGSTVLQLAMARSGTTKKSRRIMGGILLNERSTKVG